MTSKDVCPVCSASLAGCNRSGCDGRERAGWRGPTHPALDSEIWPVCVCPDCTRCGCGQAWRHHANTTEVERLKPMPCEVSDR